jgi:hemolysin III
MVEESQAIRVKPRLRGVSHQWAFCAAVLAGVALVAEAPDGRSTFAAAVYAASVAALFGSSALYHRITWVSKAARQWMRRLDHSMIFVLIAGTYTPIALLDLKGTLATVILAVVWVGALAGAVLKLAWVDSPKWFTALVYVSLGWVAVAVTPQLVSAIGVGALILIGVGGVLYTAGACIYALQRPDPVPAVFGYHELFHALVIAAAALHYFVIAFWVVPT